MSESASARPPSPGVEAAHEQRSTLDVAIGWQLAVQHAAPRVQLTRGAIGLIAVVLVALLVRAAELGHPVHAALSGPSLGLALPLMAYAIASRVLTGSSLLGRVDEPARYGSSRRRVAFGLGLHTTLETAILGAVFGMATVLVVRGGAAPAPEISLAADAALSAGIGALAGFAYAQVLWLASSFGMGRRARFAALGLDWLLGSASGAIALPWPRAHVETLVGGSGAVELSDAASYGCLWAIGIAAALVTWWRIPD